MGAFLLSIVHPAMAMPVLDANSRPPALISAVGQSSGISSKEVAYLVNMTLGDTSCWFDKEHICLTYLVHLYKPCFISQELHNCVKIACTVLPSCTSDVERYIGLESQVGFDHPFTCSRPFLAMWLRIVMGVTFTHCVITSYPLILNLSVHLQIKSKRLR